MRAFIAWILLSASLGVAAVPQSVPADAELTLMREKIAAYRAIYGRDNHAAILAALARYFPKRVFVIDADRAGKAFYVVADDRRSEIFMFSLLPVED